AAQGRADPLAKTAVVPIDDARRGVAQQAPAARARGEQVGQEKQEKEAQPRPEERQLRPNGGDEYAHVAGRAEPEVVDVERDDPPTKQEDADGDEGEDDQRAPARGVQLRLLRGPGSGRTRGGRYAESRRATAEGAGDLDVRTGVTHLFQRGGGVGLAGMAAEVDEEHVLPRLAARGARFDAGEVDLAAGKDGEHVVERADAVANRE